MLKPKQLVGDPCPQLDCETDTKQTALAAHIDRTLDAEPYLPLQELRDDCLHRWPGLGDCH